MWRQQQQQQQQSLVYSVFDNKLSDSSLRRKALCPQKTLLLACGEKPCARRSLRSRPTPT
ncbi:unnamed protein product [Ectocarpus sp. 8 AP-2014]